MSFEFEKPTCYSPNGLVFGVLRENHAYSAPCRTFAGGPFDNRIIWYFVPKDTPVYEGVNAFEPRVDEMFDRVNDTFEKAGFGLHPRKHYSGRDLWFRDASGVIGDAEDFAGLAPADKCHCQEGPPHPPCVTGPHQFSEIGFTSKMRLPAAETSVGMMKLGTILTRPADLYARVGLDLGAVFTWVDTGPVKFKAGLALGAVFVGSPASPAKMTTELALGAIFVGSPITPPEMTTGLALGAKITYVPVGPFYFSSGLALGDLFTYVPIGPFYFRSGLALGEKFVGSPIAPMHVTSGLALGTKFTYVSVGPFYFRSGLALGETFIGSPTSPIPFTAGLALGGDIAEIFFGSGSGSVSGSGSGVGGDGNSCETAMNMDNGVEYTFDVPADGPYQWFEFWLPAGWTADIAYKTNSGVTRNIVWYHGSCDDLHAIRFTSEPLITFPYGPVGVADWIIGEVINPGLGAGNYTIRITAEV